MLSVSSEIAYIEDRKFKLNFLGDPGAGPDLAVCRGELILKPATEWDVFR